VRRTLLRRGAAFVASLLCAAAALAGPEADAIRAAKADVMSRPEFRYTELAGSPSLVMRFLQWVHDLMAGMQASNPVLFWVVVSGMIVVFVAIVGHMGWTIVVVRRGPRRVRDPEDLAAALRHVDPRPFRDAAVAHARAGRLDEAVRDLYVALLLTLDRRGSLRYAPHKALLDYRMETSKETAARAVLDRFAAAYPPGSFGRRPPRADAFDELLADVDALGAQPA
jgi:hypothetical protein